jgi:hypothetical protein
MVAGIYLGKKETKSLAKTKLALRPYAIVASRERRQGSAINGPARIAGPPLPPLPPCQQIAIRETALVEAHGVVRSKELKPGEKFKTTLTRPALLEMSG